MLVRIERRSAVRSPEPTMSPRAQLVELVSPRTNGANYTPIEHLFCHAGAGGGSVARGRVGPLDPVSSQELGAKRR